MKKIIALLFVLLLLSTAMAESVETAGDVVPEPVEEAIPEVEYTLEEDFVEVEDASESMLATSDSESSLRSILSGKMGGGTIMHFFYDDYDKDGKHEAFAFVRKSYDRVSESYTGDVWFVSAGYTSRLIQEGDFWNEFQALGTPPNKFFIAGEYRTTTSKIDMWVVQKSRPVGVSASINGIHAGDSDTPLFCTVDAYDAGTDGTGHTWKSYFFYLENAKLREFGGITITKAQFEKFKNASSVISKYTNKGYRLTSIIYRANHIINVNFTKGSGSSGWNSYVTVKYDNTSVKIVEEGSGIYKTASNPKIATYPKKFVAPGGSSTSTTSAKPTSISLNYNGTVSLNLGEKLNLVATLNPAGSSSKLAWKTSKKKVAKVSSSGVVTAVKEGTATITVSTANKKKATVKVKVVDPYKPTSIALNYTGTATVKKGESIYLKVTYTPEDAYSALTWKSSKPKIAKVSSNGAVTALKAGTTTITVTTKNKKKASVKVKVVSAVQEPLPQSNEMEDYIGQDIAKAAAALGMKISSGKESWLKDHKKWPVYDSLIYEKGDLRMEIFDPWDNADGFDGGVDVIYLEDSSNKQYTFAGVRVGMTEAVAQKAAAAKGWMTDGSGYYCIECTKTIKGREVKLYVDIENGVVTGFQMVRE